MNTDSWSPYILTLVTFAPLAGALLLVLLPRRDRDIRIFALVVSLLTFRSLAASAGALPSRAGGLPVRNRHVRGFPPPTFTTTWAWTAFRCGWWC